VAASAAEGRSLESLFSPVGRFRESDESLRRHRELAIGTNRDRDEEGLPEERGKDNPSLHLQQQRVFSKILPHKCSR